MRPAFPPAKEQETNSEDGKARRIAERVKTKAVGSESESFCAERDCDVGYAPAGRKRDGQRNATDAVLDAGAHSLSECSPDLLPGNFSSIIFGYGPKASVDLIERVRHVGICGSSVGAYKTDGLHRLGKGGKVNRYCEI